MMRNSHDGHLREAQVIWAVVDEKELPEEDHQHFMECRFCQGKVEQFMAELQVFGKRAELSVPPMTKKLRMPAAEPATAKFRTKWMAFAGTAVMAGLVLFFYFIGMDARSPQLTMVPGPGNQFEDEYLMQEISEMVEFPLPEDLYEITGDAADFDDDFLQFVIPDLEEDFQT